MTKLADYKGADAFELWADLVEPIVRIMQDEEIVDVVKSGKSKFKIATAILRNHKEDAEEILTRIDPEPINGLTIITRTIQLLSEIGSDPTIESFFA